MASSWKHQNDKANAVTRFQRKRNLETIFHLFNVCAAILVFFHYSSLFPITIQTSFSHFYQVLLPLFCNSFYAFLLLNAIILFLFALANNNNNVGASKHVYHKISDHNQEQSHKKITTFHDSKVGEALSKSSPVFEETVRAVSAETTTCCYTTVTTTDGESVSVSDKKEKKCYRRVQSESDMVVAPPSRGELKRCDTTMQRCVEVEHLNEEEFNRAIEEFIAMHKRMQWEESKQGIWPALPQIKLKL